MFKSEKQMYIEVLGRVFTLGRFTRNSQDSNIELTVDKKEKTANLRPLCDPNRKSDLHEPSPSPRPEGQPVSAKKRTSVTKVSLFEEIETSPKFSFHLRPRLIQTNHSCKLICCVTGNPPPTVTWTKDGRPVNEDRLHVDTRHGVCSLEIYNVRLDDAGRYSCTAENKLGIAETSCVLSVQNKRGGDVEPMQMSRMSDYSSSRSTTSRRTYGRSDLYVDESPITKSVSSMEIRRSSAIRESEEIRKKTSRLATDDIVAAAKSQQPETPNFSRPLVDVEVDEGQTAEFSCRVDGRPSPETHWLKNGESLRIPAPNLWSSYNGDDGTAVLRISNAGVGDERRRRRRGRIRLPGGERIGLQFDQSQINTAVNRVPDASPAIDGPSSVSNGESKSPNGDQAPSPPLALSKDLESSPTDVVWLRNGKEVKSNGRFKQEKDETNGIYRLSISQCSPEDSAGANVPQVVRLPQPVTAKVGDNVKFTLDLVDITNLTVQWFQGQDKVEKSENVKSVKSGNTFKLEFKSVSPNNAGQYTVKVIKDKKAIAKYTASLNVAS
uniref:Ig-like domain-containing protein n=1 Tax=Romanomermis culicivorax TaxID=13658 RepID=A0A915JMG8_ROMCU